TLAARAKGVAEPAPASPDKTPPPARQNEHATSESNEASKGGGAGGSLKTLLGLLRQFRFEYLSLVSITSLLSGIEGILQPLLVKSIFDEGVLKRDFGAFMVLVVSYVTLGLLINLARTGTSLWNKSLENRVVQRMSRRLLESFYEKEYAPILQNGHGYFINRIYGDLREGLVPLLSLVQTTANQAVLLVSFSLVLAYLSWKAFLCLAVLIPISAAASAVLGRRIRALTSQEREQEGAVLAMLSKALGAFRMVRVFNLLPRTAHVYDRRLDDYLSTGYKRYRVTRLFQPLNDSTMVISDFLSMFVGALFVLRGALTFGGYLAFVNTFWRAVTTLMQLFNRSADFHTYGVITKRVASSLSPPAKAYYHTGDSPSVSGVRFSYGDAPILKDFSLRLSPGERVVVVGSNGSGKTTLAHILSGYLAPSEGDVVLPERVSSVTLPILFPPLKVKELIGDTCLLSAFRLWDDAVLEAFADELSAGQQQKLALSLALSQEADLYVLDEPLANLDQESRATAMDIILERTEGKTLVLVMHGSEEYHTLFDRVIRLDAASGNSGRRLENTLAV
ncbi:MAG TPA: ABC transporter ATP-binding protein, partial [Ardenticatenaceae bacterium]|nr:ABC transporter ATP-binding protein [Ardenticatenaceae bacterium]